MSIHFDESLHGKPLQGFTVKVEDQTGSSTPYKVTNYVPPEIRMYGLTGTCKVGLLTHYNLPRKGWWRSTPVLTVRSQDAYVDFRLNTDPDDPAKIELSKQIYHALADHFKDIGYPEIQVHALTGVEVKLSRTDTPVLTQAQEICRELQQISYNRTTSKGILEVDAKKKPPRPSGDELLEAIVETAGRHFRLGKKITYERLGAFKTELEGVLSPQTAGSGKWQKRLTADMVKRVVAHAVKHFANETLATTEDHGRFKTEVGYMLERSK